MEKTNSPYILKLWNGKYGNGAQFIVQDTKTQKYALYSPARYKDIAWVADDLTKTPEYKSWESFEDEPVDDLSQVIM